jgi:hypothetical protein
MSVVVSHPDETIAIGTDSNQQPSIVQEESNEPTTVINIELTEVRSHKYKKYIYICLMIDLWRFFLYPKLTIYILLNVVSGMFCFRGLQSSSNWMIWIYGFYHLFECVFFTCILFLYPTLNLIVTGIFSIIYDLCCFHFVRRYIKEQSLV